MSCSYLAEDKYGVSSFPSQGTGSSYILELPPTGSSMGTNAKGFVVDGNITLWIVATVIAPSPPRGGVTVDRRCGLVGPTSALFCFDVYCVGLAHDRSRTPDCRLEALANASWKSSCSTNSPKEWLGEMLCLPHSKRVSREVDSRLSVLALSKLRGSLLLAKCLEQT
ncbi:hypothetical protein BD410DRAFT_470548 [Rickenella mellea]|uniref:Uncharacterized protein n=1 Tax=Rickenella mellea TaxID=50990 RepID=A0A4Y7QJ04_9AGAM|nr:hypothetical protein BD410DRAFT_470548 [Rickenella mellea]